MKDVFLIRKKRSSHGTRGILVLNEFACFTMELPWKDNQGNISCIPAGEYTVTIRKSPKYGTIYWILEVEGRKYILIHSGNYGGDISLGLKTHTKGCILLGKSKGSIGGQRAVLNSRITVRKFMNLLGNEPFTLRIIEEF